MSTPQFQAGLDLLAQPILPLIRLVQLLFLTGPFDTIHEVVAELNEPIETVVRYEEPAKALAPYLDLMRDFERLKAPRSADYSIVDEAGEPLPQMEAIDLWIAQHVVSRELEDINSLLCGPCHCALCCIGPSPELHQLFFEIPLKPNETTLFPLPTLDTPETRQLTPDSAHTMQVAGRPFYEHEGPALYRWRSGWSMILPRNATCPHLLTTEACSIYPSRPEVCRKPQIFAYILDHAQENSAASQSTPLATFQATRKILAIWDCPYVKRFQNEIAAYAELCELEPIFKENKH
ncbi:MAG: YkgJ family cysteine cluster protein [Desulfobulbaceae bacterium]|nr:YkgJ family cysteine cluster protein [Desulfobulbaceae bacterium]